MISRISFSLIVESGIRFDGLHVDLKQTVGRQFGDRPHIEVGPILGYEGPMNYEAFRKAVESYYHSLVGPQGRAIKLGSDSHHVILMDILTEFPMETSFEVEADSNRAWQNSN